MSGLEAAQIWLQGTLRGLDEQVDDIKYDFEWYAENMDMKAKTADNASAYCIEMMGKKVKK